MRTLLTALLFLMIAQAPAAAAEIETTWLPIPVDKAAHFGLSYMITDQLIRAGLPPVEALGVSLFLGWCKEVADGRIDGGDLAADAAGSLAGAYLRVQFGW